MPLLLLLVLMLASLPINWPPPIVGDQRGSLLTSVAVIGVLLTLAWVFTRKTIHQLEEDWASHDAVGREHSMRRLLFFFAGIAGFAFILVVGGWGWAVRQWMTVDDLLWPGAEFVILLPYFVVLGGSWLIFYDAERALHDTDHLRANAHPFWSRGGYVLFLLRHHLLMIFLPMFLVITQMGVARTFPEWLDTPVGMVTATVAMLAFILLLPSLIPLILGLQPMPDGPLRQRLEASAARLGIRYRNLYIWNTRSNLATAMVAGLIGPVRNIVFTDLLLATLTDDEIEAVLGHEAGHVRHGHLLYYTVFLLVSFAALGVGYRVIELSPWASTIPADLLLILSVFVTGLYLFIVFGFLSRRCERQADIFGCRTVSCANPACEAHSHSTTLVPRGRALCSTGIRTFINALERVEEINGVVRRVPSPNRNILFNRLTNLLRMIGVVMATWQHSTIAKRVAFLQTMLEQPEVESRFQRRVALIRWGLLVGLIVLTISFSLWHATPPT